MRKYTFLTHEQFFEDGDKLEVIEKRGTKAAITDFSVLLGGHVVDNFHINGDDSLEGRTGWYWTKSACNDSSARDVDYTGNRNYAGVSFRSTGTRPALPFLSMREIPTNRVNSRRLSNGVQEVEYGYYPQKAVSKQMQNELERMLTSRELQRTGNGYTTDSTPYDKYDEKFKPQRHEEFEYNGKRYVRVIANSCFNGAEFILSNGEKYKDGDAVWVEVEPIKWLVDEKARIMITDKIIFAGVQLNNEKNYRTEDFDKTDIKKFMDEYWSKDIEQVRSQEKSESKAEEEQGPISGKKRKGNPFGFKKREEPMTAEEKIQAYIDSNVPVFLHGKPGIGKTARLRQIDPDLTQITLSQKTPEKVHGIEVPYETRKAEIESQKAELLIAGIKPPWLEELEAKCEREPDKNHLLFFEELTNAYPQVQTLAMAIIGERRVGDKWKLPENCRIVAAGNEIEDSLGASEQIRPLFERMAHVTIESNPEQWLKWAITEGKIHPAVTAFVNYYNRMGEDVLYTDLEDGELFHATPRNWELVSKTLYETGELEAVDGIVGEEIGSAFSAFCQNARYCVEDILEGNYTSEDIEELDLGEKYATVAGLTVVEPEDMPEIRNFIQTKMRAPELVSVFDSMWIGNDREREEEIEDIKDKEQDVLAFEKQGLSGKMQLARMAKVEEQEVDVKISAFEKKLER